MFSRNPFDIKGNPLLFSIVAGLEERPEFNGIKSITSFAIRINASNYSSYEITQNFNPKVYFILTGGSIVNYESSNIVFQGRGADNIPLHYYVSATAGSSSLTNNIAAANRYISAIVLTHPSTRLQLTGFRIELN